MSPVPATMAAASRASALTGYAAAVAAFAPSNGWSLKEPSGAFADTFGSVPLTLEGTGATRAISTGLTAVGNGVNFAGTSWAGSGTTTPLPQVGSNGFSICGWIFNTSNPGSFTRPWYAASISTHVDPFYAFQLDGNPSNHYRIWVSSGGAGTNITVDTSVNIMNTTDWHHLGFIYDLAADTFTITLDGVAVYGPTSQTAKTTVASMSCFALAGIEALGAGFNPDCKMAWWAYWNNTVLTVANMATLNTAGRA